MPRSWRPKKSFVVKKVGAKSPLFDEGIRSVVGTRKKRPQRIRQRPNPKYSLETEVREYDDIDAVLRRAKSRGKKEPGRGRSYNRNDRRISQKRAHEIVSMREGFGKHGKTKQGKMRKLRREKKSDPKIV